ncbi:MAG TPA: sulfite exporter TauE/SafE family protein [Candidatus Limnocylindrales bacterium]|nr:sulfite exporter TauE/SafE family protein [Candidatus Limnocylindrales bacterium]
MAIALIMVAGGAAAGLFGSLLGLGGGILIVPLLTLGFDIPLREAVGVSLVCVIMTSSASAGVYLERHVANLRLGMTLELFTAAGALIGGLVAFSLDERWVAALFALLLVYTGVSMLRRGKPAPPLPSRADGADDGPSTFTERLSGPDYRVHRLGIGAFGSVGAGVVSALLGIGGGVVKVPLMHLGLGVPLRVATATSNLMIGITAAAGAIIYLARGGIDPYVAGPTAVGVFIGASVGSRIAHRIDLRVLRVLFVVVLAYTAFQLFRRALGL